MKDGVEYRVGSTGDDSCEVTTEMDLMVWKEWNPFPSGSGVFYNYLLRTYLQYLVISVKIYEKYLDISTILPNYHQ